MIKPTTDGTNAVDPGISRRTAHGAFACAGRTDAMIPAADERIVQGARRLFRRINDLQVFDATPPAFLAHDLGQRAHGGLIDIRYTKSRG